jgi:hypothetical protein
MLGALYPVSDDEVPIPSLLVPSPQRPSTLAVAASLTDCNLTNEPLPVKYDRKSLAFSEVSKWLQSGQMRASSVVLKSTETRKFSDATYVWKKSKYTCATS